MARDKSPTPLTAFETLAMLFGMFGMLCIAGFLLSTPLDPDEPTGSRASSALMAYFFIIGIGIAIAYLSNSSLVSARSPVWKLAALSFASYSAFAAMLAILPYFSPLIMLAGFMLSAVATISGLVYTKHESPAARCISLAAFPTLLFGIGLRSWSAMLGNGGAWLAVLVAAYFVAWLLPFLSPRVSTFLFREQTTPRTKVGKAALAIVFALAPSAATLGALTGMYLPRLGRQHEAMLILAILGTVGGLGCAQAFSHQLRSGVQAPARG
jgi:hypothetical protein